MCVCPKERNKQKQSHSNGKTHVSNVFVPFRLFSSELPFKHFTNQFAQTFPFCLTVMKSCCELCLCICQGCDRSQCDRYQRRGEQLTCESGIRSSARGGSTSFGCAAPLAPSARLSPSTVSSCHDAERRRRGCPPDALLGFSLPS